MLISVGLADPPAYRLRDRQMEYYGPGREPDSTDAMDEIRIAWFGPDDPKYPDGGDLWSAAQLALDEANASGGYRGTKFRLLPVWSETPWDEGARRLAELVYEKRVVAIVGGIDGASTHVAEQISAKACLPVIAPASTDKSVNLAGVPWMFSCLPGDHLLAPVLADSIASHGSARRIVLLSSTDHDARLFTTELLAALRDRKIVLAQHYEIAAKTANMSELSVRALNAEPEAVIVVADPRISADLVVALRGAGFGGDVYCGPSAARHRFLEIAKSAAEGVSVPLPSCLADCRSDQQKQFVARFRERCGHRPDFAAAQSYDAARMLVAAIRKVGPNRARIGDCLRELSPYEGVAGTIRWDPVGANTRAVQLGVYRDGRLVAAE